LSASTIVPANQHAWILDQMERFTRAFRSRIDGLNLDMSDDGSEAAIEPSSG